MKIRSSSITMVDVNSLVPHPKNCHDHPKEQIERLAKIIEYQGFRNPLTVQAGTNLIVTGHGRLMAAKKLGMKEVPVIYQEFESDEQLYAHLVADNAIGKDTWATLDLSAINLELENLGPDLDIDMLGLKDFVLEPADKLDPKTDEDEVPEVEHAITRRGDIWLLGNHRLMCGDSTMIDDVEKLMNGEKAKMLHTDPPYGIDYEGVPNDDLKSEKLREFIFKALSNAFVSLDEASNVYIWHADIHSYEFIGAMRDAGFTQARPAFILWIKDSLNLSQGDYHPKFEPCLYGWKKGKNRLRVEDRKQSNVWEFPKPKKNDEHTTMKPVELCQKSIENATKPSWLVLDLFLGSGSTLIACEKTNRKCYGMELDEHYCDVIINRWQNFTGKEAVLEQTGETYNALKETRDANA